MHILTLALSLYHQIS